MLKVDDKNRIHFTKGDTGYLTVEVEANDKPYTLEETDVLKMTVRNPLTKEKIIYKESTGANTFVLDPSDTKEVNQGRYTYDIELTCESGVFTIRKADFYLEGEDTYD